MTEADATEPANTDTPKRTRKSAAAPGARANPGGSTGTVRTELLVALGVLKIVTGDQMWRLLRPKAVGNKFARAGLNDLEKAGLVVSEGSTKDALKTWRLTAAGATAAEQVLPTGRTVGSLAKGAGVHGAAHAMSVNDTVIAFVRGALEPDSAGAVGSITSWHTEYPIEVRAGLKVRPDAVLRAPEIGLPVLLVEVDRHTENRPVLAAKFPAYAAVFAHQTKVPDPASRSGSTTTVPTWQQLFPGADPHRYPPVAVVFADNATELVTRNRMRELAKATRSEWRGDTGNGVYADYSRRIPVVVTTLDLLRRHGPMAPIWWRFGHSGRETLLQALANPDDATAYWDQRDAREQADALARQEAEREREEAEREATRCPDCHRTADQYEDPGQAGGDGDPCEPCAATRKQAQETAQEQEELAARTAAYADVQERDAFVTQWKKDTSPWRAIGRQAVDWGSELHAAWQARQAARHPAAPPARFTPPTAPATATARRSSTSPRTPAARAAFTQLLAELHDEPAQQPAPDRESDRDAVVGTEAPDPQDHDPADKAAARIRMELELARFRAEAEAQLPGITEPLRTKMVELALQRRREAIEQAASS